MQGEWVRIGLVMFGGGTGAVLRYLISRVATHLLPLGGFPWHTFAINIVGSFMLGLVALTYKDRPGWYLLLGTGFCGGFTTFSTFSVEMLTLLEKNRLVLAILYAFGSVLLGLLTAWLAFRLLKHGTV